MPGYVANDPEGSRIPIPGPGRDALWTDPAAMYGAGLEYFQIKTQAKQRFTVSGLALHLGMSHWTLNEYQAKPAFTAIVKRLKDFIVEQGELALWDKDTVNGAKFHLGVLGMRDTQQVELISKNTNVNVNAEAKSLESLTNEQLAKLAEAVGILADHGANPSGANPAEAEQDQNPVSGHGGSPA